MQNENENKITPEVEKVEPIAIYKNNIYALVDDVKQESQFQGLTDEELKNNKAFFPVLVDYIYNHYIGELLGNKHGKQVVYNDIQLLDNIFSIYCDLVYKYKWNNRPLIVEYSLLTGVSKSVIYKWLNGEYKGVYNSDPNTAGSDNRDATLERVDIVQKWVDTCERGLVDGNDTIKDIFILKAKYGWKDNNNDIQITVNHKQIIAADDLPALIDVTNTGK